MFAILPLFTVAITTNNIGVAYAQPASENWHNAPMEKICGDKVCDSQNGINSAEEREEASKQYISENQEREDTKTQFTRTNQ